MWRLLAALLAGLAIAWPVRVALARRLRALLRRFAGELPVARMIEAVAGVVLTTASFGLAAFVVLMGVDRWPPLAPLMQQLDPTVIAGCAVIGFAAGLGRALRDVGDPSYKAFPTFVAPWWVFSLCFPLWGVLLAASGLTQKTLEILVVPERTRVAAHAVIVILEAVSLSAFLVAVGRSRNRRIASDVSAKATGTALTGVGWLALILAVLSVVFGRPPLTLLIVQESILIMLVVAFVALIGSTIHQVTEWQLSADRGLRRFALHVVGLPAGRVAQLVILAAGVLTSIVWIGGLMVLATPILAGSEVTFVDQLRARAVLDVFRDLPIPPQAAFFGLAVLVAGACLTHLVKLWLERRFLPATSLDVGSRAAIVTGFGYASILLVLIAALTATGIDLAKITLIASALSVGIGFGLQSIIQNFVSGIILLVERPIKVGDWVTVSGAEGSVQHISVRATQLATADGSTMIVPNSSFISGSVTNRAHEGIAGRVQIAIRIGGGGSAKDVSAKIMAIIDDVDEVLKSPASELLLTDVNADGIGYTLQVYADRGSPVAVFRSKLLYALLEELPSDMKIVIT